ncbi:DUF6265 family protein [Aquimarina muelleri]|uniref:DUF6265 domain-containing protein n=1 Tax=Aquimarina muelleri TaxID=279356 RepID=A0A918JUY6_9FLAO|nr:DUF6265 family protein [Aquimarina muelleri]MCX2761292.1 DUF6265 family protein [Aquimarina muelleri]GGX12324.1 hypothetical protein GCM10007384_12630 [Aquimarina muelleri]
MKQKSIIICIVLGAICSSFAQSTESNVLKFTDDMISPNATLEDLSWISGYWRGEAFGGITEEIWSDPLGNSMMFSFKLVVNDTVKFYELGGITQIDSTLLMQLKHFNGDFKGWEKKEETVDFKLVKVEKDKVYFDELTFERISDSEINVYLVIDDKDGSSEEVQFNYKKQ